MLVATWDQGEGCIFCAKEGLPRASTVGSPQWSQGSPDLRHSSFAQLSKRPVDDLTVIFSKKGKYFFRAKKMQPVVVIGTFPRQSDTWITGTRDPCVGSGADHATFLDPQPSTRSKPRCTLLGKFISCKLGRWGPLWLYHRTNRMVPIPLSSPSHATLTSESLIFECQIHRYHSGS